MKNQENFDFRRKGTSTDVTDEMSQMLEGSDGDSSCCYTSQQLRTFRKQMEK